MTEPVELKLVKIRGVYTVNSMTKLKATATYRLSTGTT